MATPAAALCGVAATAGYGVRKMTVMVMRSRQTQMRVSKGTYMGKQRQTGKLRGGTLGFRLGFPPASKPDAEVAAEVAAGVALLHGIVTDPSVSGLRSLERVVVLMHPRAQRGAS